MNTLLSTAYLPDINWLSLFLSSENPVIERNENFIKQTHRNRCEILSANGRLILSVPLVKEHGKELISQKRISYAEKWQLKHWRAITSAYKNSPYFEYFEQDLLPFYHQQHEYLLEYNTSLLKTLLHILRIQKNIEFTSEFISNGNFIDYRNEIPKEKYINILPYPQVFDVKFPFEKDLSCIDLIFNTGLEAKKMLSLHT